jgi:hypothetical protein
LHPKPYNLQHPGELWKHTAFDSQEEYTAFLEQPVMLGKPTASHPNGGMKQKYHDFADKLWNKFKVVRREIASSTSVIWARLLPNNLLPSGKLMPDIVRLLLDPFLSCFTAALLTVAGASDDIDSELDEYNSNNILVKSAALI